MNAKNNLQKMQVYYAFAKQSEFSSGRTKPLQLQCYNSEDKSIIKEFVVKYNLANIHGGYMGLICELLCSFLAQNIGLSIPESAIIVISKEFAESVTDISTSSLIMQNCGLRFGSEFYKGFSSWVLNSDNRKHIINQAFDILLFDIFIQNVDRRKEKPNLGLVDNRIYIIDHEMAFSFLYNIPSTNNDSLSFIPILKNHFFFTLLKGRKIDQESILVEKISLLDENIIKHWFKQIPEEWLSENAKTKLDIIYSYLLSERKKINKINSNLRSYLK